MKAAFTASTQAGMTEDGRYGALDLNTVGREGVGDVESVGCCMKAACTASTQAGMTEDGQYGALNRNTVNTAHALP